MPTKADRSIAPKSKTTSVSTSTEAFEFRVTRKHPHIMQHLRTGAAKADMDMAEFARQAVEAAYQRIQKGLPLEGEVDWANAGTASFQAPYLARIPCGPWREAVQTDQTYTIHEVQAEEFEAQEGDVFMRADGSSMDGLGIRDNYVVLVRPFKTRVPRRGDIVLVQAFTDDEGDAILATLKKFEKYDASGLPVLKDGDDELFPLPEGTLRAEIVARAVGVVGSI